MRHQTNGLIQADTPIEGELDNLCSHQKEIVNFINGIHTKFVVGNDEVEAEIVADYVIIHFGCRLSATFYSINDLIIHIKIKWPVYIKMGPATLIFKATHPANSFADNTNKITQSVFNI